MDAIHETVFRYSSIYVLCDTTPRRGLVVVCCAVQHWCEVVILEASDGRDYASLSDWQKSCTYHCKMTWLGETVEVSRDFPEP